MIAIIISLKHHRKEIWIISSWFLIITVEKMFMIICNVYAHTYNTFDYF